MGENNVLSGGIEELNTLKEYLLELEGCQVKSDELDIEEERLEKLLAAKEKQIEDEIFSVVKKRKDEIGATYDAQMDKTSARLKKTKNKKEKQKNAKISERIDLQTSDLWEENNHLKIEARTLLKQNHVPSLCNMGIYYMLFSPRGAGDLLGTLFFILVTLLGIPCGIYYSIPERKTWHLILIYFITVILAAILYLFIYNKTMDKHADTIKKVKEVKKKITVNKKKIGIIKKEIIKDKDESIYGLEGYDHEIADLQEQMAGFAEQKKNALLTFENTTRNVIAEEIKTHHAQELEELRTQYNEVYKESTSYENKVKEMAVNLADHYEAYLGKEFMSLEKADALIAIMETEGISNVSEAIEAYRKQL